MHHFVSTRCNGEKCRICKKPAAHKVGEEIPSDDPFQQRHEFTAYVCCEHFRLIMGNAVFCPPGPIQIELQELLNTFLSRYPDNTRELADEFSVSLPTLERWREGKNLPHQAMAEPIVERLKNRLETANIDPMEK